MGGKGSRVFRNYYKGQMDKTKGGGIKAGRWEWLGWGGEGEGLAGTTIKDTWTKPRGRVEVGAVSYTHLTLPTNTVTCRSRWSPYH